MVGYAEVFETYAQRAPELRERWNNLDLARWLSPVAPHLNGHHVLDIGSGTGRLAQHLAARARVTAVEPVSALWSVPLPRVDDRLPRLRKIRGQFDLVLCLGVFHHLSPRDQRAAMVRMAALMRPGGTLVLATRHGTTWRSSWPIDAAKLNAPGLTRLSITRRPAQQPQNRAQGVRFTWLIWRKTSKA